ncbi:MAG: hypothetical protein ACWA47_13895 [Brevirhabdus sp.]
MIDIVFVGKKASLLRDADCSRQDAVASVQCVPFSQFTAELLARLRPPVVVSAHATDEFDMLDIVQVLHRADFAGRYVVHCGDVPDTAILFEEARRISPAVDIELVTNAELGA